MAKKITSKKTKVKKVKKKLSPEEKAIRKEQREQKKEIINIFKNIGFEKLPYIDGKEFVYEGRTSEMDDIFICENVILITEYTIGDPGTHILKKNFFYDKLLSDKRKFIHFLLSEEKLSSFKKYFDQKIKDKYSENQLIIKVIYCSKKSVNEEHKKLVNSEVTFFDYHIVKYFRSLTKVVKKSSKFEFLDFLKINFDDFGKNILKSSKDQKETFSGHILPEEKSKFKKGYKIVSFYIDAESLLKRSYVLRNEGWRDQENVGYYQRMIDSRKITSMRKYLSEKDRVFINNIISTISIDNVKLLDNDGNEFEIDESGQFTSENSSTQVTPTQIEIDEKVNIIGLIDGQHRTYAYHEGDDQYESKISNLRTVQNLLVTAIIFPKDETRENRMKFEANLFLEINSTQSNVRTTLKQEIETMINPFSITAISKRVLYKLNSSGPLNNLIEQYSFDRNKIKTSSIVSFGLKPLLKLEDVKSSDSLFSIWNNEEKQKIKVKDSTESELLNEYIGFSTEKIRDLIIAFKSNLNANKWKTYIRSKPEGILNVTFINGVLNVLRLLIENKKVNTVQEYTKFLKDIDSFDFKKYKSSQYRKMGEEIYKKYFNS